MKSLMLWITLVSWSNSLFSFNFTPDYNKGFYWSSFPISMSYYGLTSEESSQLNSFTSSAIEEWESNLGEDVWDHAGAISSNYLSSVNNIRWSRNFQEETGYDSVTTLAVTIRYSAGTLFERTEIILNGSNFNLRNNIGNLLKSTILHELGHTLGLDHSSEFAIMAAAANGLSSLQQDDVAGAAHAIAEMKEKQRTGYISPYATEDKVSACGTVEYVNNDPPEGPGGFMSSLFTGVILSGLFAGFRRRSFLSKLQTA